MFRTDGRREMLAGFIPKTKVCPFSGGSGGIFPKIRGGFTKNNRIRARRTAMIF